MADAMAVLRREMGDDAIIVSTESTLKGVKIVAAVEEREDFIDNFGSVRGGGPAATLDDDPVDAIHEALQGQGLPNPLIEKLVDAAFLAGVDTPDGALRAALEAVYGFQPLSDRGPNQPIMLIGQPGVGKTMCIAKLAARAVLAGRAVRLITTDIVRAGAVEQLGAFAKILDAPLATAENDRELGRVVGVAAPGELVLIDTAGVNPYSPRDMTELARLIRGVPAEPIAVLAGGGDVMDAIDQAQVFATLGVNRLITTKLDLARRLGSVLAAADSARLALAEFSATPDVADGLTSFSAAELTKFLLPDTQPAQPAKATARGYRS
jgi:flagellar biosynthesis protein FlhF